MLVHARFVVLTSERRGAILELRFAQILRCEANGQQWDRTAPWLGSDAIEAATASK